MCITYSNSHRLLTLEQTESGGAVGAERDSRGSATVGIENKVRSAGPTALAAGRGGVCLCKTKPVHCAYGEPYEAESGI